MDEMDGNDSVAASQRKEQAELRALLHALKEELRQLRMLKEEVDALRAEVQDAAPNDDGESGS